MEGTPTKVSSGSLCTPTKVLPGTSGSAQTPTKGTPSKARPRACCYGVSMDSPPGEEHVQQMSGFGVFQVRWCKDPTGAGYQWFMWHTSATYVSNWGILVNLLGGSESCNSEDKSRTHSIWMIYGRKMGMKTLGELNANLVTVNSDTPNRKKSKKDKENSPPTPSQKDPVKQALALHAPLALVMQPLVLPVPPPPPQEEQQEEKGFFGCMRAYLSHPAPYEERETPMTSIVAQITQKHLRIKQNDDIWITHPAKGSPNFAVTPGMNAIAIPIIELHRRVLALERLAAGLFQQIHIWVASPAFDSVEEGHIVEIASHLTGLAPLGEGPGFWKISEEQEAYPPRILLCAHGKSELGRCVEWMHLNRENAFKRTYITGDPETWWFPVVCNVFTTCHKVDAPGATIKANLERMVKIRANIILQERGYMLRYGGHMTQYCRGLAALLRKMGAPPLPTYLQLVVLEEDGSYVKIKDDDRVLPIGNFEGQPLSKVQDVYTSVALRVKEEKRVVQETCKILKIQFPPVLATNLKAFFRALQKAMATDTHIRNATKHMAPSPSLPNATFDPAQWRK